MNEYRKISDTVKAICEPRWAGWPERNRRDPCDCCPLHQPCIRQSPGPGLESLNRWVDGINAAADEIQPT